MQREFDVVVLGAGNAGIAAATRARGAEKSVALVEARDAGGTCPLRGCVPKKVWVAAAEVLDSIARAERHGISVGSPRIDWAKALGRKRSIIAGTSEDFERTFRDRGIEYVRGAARFTGPNAVSVSGDALRAERFVVATGSKPRTLPIPGFEHVITSDDILELEAVPSEIVFIGGGAIALEFTHVFARAGAKVTILEATPRLLPMFDTEIVDRIAEATRALGVVIHTAVNIREIRRDGAAMEVLYESAGKTLTLRGAVIANGTGRVPALDDLDLSRAGVKLDGGKPVLRPDLSAEGNPNIYFAGDAHPGRQQLSPVATWMGGIAANNLLGRPAIVPDFSAIPGVVFTIPAIASVGMTEEDAQKKKVACEVKRSDMRSWRSARTYAEDVAFAKIVVEPNGGRILGAQLAGHGAQETIHAFAMAIRFGITAQQLREFVYAYPTDFSDLKYVV